MSTVTHLPQISVLYLSRSFTCGVRSSSRGPCCYRTQESHLLGVRQPWTTLRLAAPGATWHLSAACCTLHCTAPSLEREPRIVRSGSCANCWHLQGLNTPTAHYTTNDWEEWNCTTILYSFRIFKCIKQLFMLICLCLCSTS